MIRLFDFLHDYWVGVILTMTLIQFISAICGFWIQGLTKGVWDLNAMWVGVGAIASAAATGYSKWWVDSKYNSTKEQMPN